MDAHHFSFGQNWLEYNQNWLTEEKLNQAKEHFDKLCGGIDFTNKKFLDVGFGQGLTLFLASQKQAQCQGIDIDPKNITAFEVAKKKLGSVEKNLAPIQVQVASILDAQFVTQNHEAFDIVYAWGSLHHTGQMYPALKNCLSLLKPGGYFVCAIYNRHWSSGTWHWIKKNYNRSPHWLKKLAIGLLIPPIFLAKWLVTFKNPLKMKRGMSFYYDVIDWVGGYPYEYASAEEMFAFFKKNSLKKIRWQKANVPTGCHEYVFQKPEKNKAPLNQ